MKTYAQLLCLALPLFLASCANTQTPALPSQNSPVGAESSIYNLKDLDTPPKAKSPRATPLYPFSLKKAGIQGEAIIRFVVDVSGSVRDVEVVSANHPAFGRAAADAVAKWRFQPGIKNGQPVNTRMQIPIGFYINEK
jgi:periplasmic protein TonB